MMTGADLIVSRLQHYGVEWIATLCGHGLDPLFRAARDAGLRLIDTRNEQTASYIADAYGKLTRRPGVCAVSSGVAHVNALAGVANAWFDSSPMLLISGAASTATSGKGHFQEMDQRAVAQALCKTSRSVLSVDDVAPSIDEAMRAATTMPCGPVHLTFPMDVQNTQVAHDPGAPPPAVEDPGVADANAVAAALADAQTPLVIAGSGVFYARSGDRLLAFCERYRIPVMTPIWDRGFVNKANSVFVGVAGAASGGPAVLSEADCVVMAGAVSDYRTGYLEAPGIRSDARVIWAGSEWDTISEACKQYKVVPREVWLAQCTARRDEFRKAVWARGEEQAARGVHAIHIIRAIERVLDTNPVLLIDGGSIGQWAHQLLCSDRYPSEWLTCGRSGVVGWGLGGAMAARLAVPDRPVILLSGDGAFTFTIADLEPAVRQRLPFVAVVADDQGWGITRTGHVRQFGEPIASSLGSIAFDEVARGLGAHGVRVSTSEAIEKELREAIHQPRVTVIHVPVVGGNPA